MKMCKAAKNRILVKGVRTTGGFGRFMAVAVSATDNDDPN
jgi:hypothetical protein